MPSNTHNPSSAPIVVLKFGSSVLNEEADLPLALLEIYREIRKGHRVIAVVSAFGSTTDTLLRDARSRFACPEPHSLARLLETGEQRSAALLGMALDEVGVSSTIIGARQLGLRTSGPVLDSEPVSLDREAALAVFDRFEVVVVPGFIGQDENHQPTLLGRGGSDLTALFLAHHLDAVECRLLKDVDGLLKVLPDGSLDHGTRYAFAHYEECLRVGGPLIQPKAVDFAAQHGLTFTIGRCGTGEGTIAGRYPSRFEAVPRQPRRIRVALAGLGNVGLGVWRWLQRLPFDFEVTGILVADPEKSRPDDVPAHLLTHSRTKFLDARPELLIEALSGTGSASRLLHGARQRGIPVVSANKQLLALDPNLLDAAVRGPVVDVSASASVGGGVPILERTTAIAREETVTRVRGVLNGTCNFVLDRMVEGLSREEAVREAQELGLAEADPFLDVSGLDSVYKLSLLASAAFGEPVTPDEVICEGLDRVSGSRVQLAWSQGRSLKLVAEARREEGKIKARVRVRALPADHPLAGCRREENAVLIDTADGQTIAVRGKGAGRWPTTLSVISDALAIRRRLVGACSTASEQPVEAKRAGG